MSPIRTAASKKLLKQLTFSSPIRVLQEQSYTHSLKTHHFHIHPCMYVPFDVGVIAVKRMKQQAMFFITPPKKSF